jgi:nucleoside-diphosphate-sugar epimerase
MPHHEVNVPAERALVTGGTGFAGSHLVQSLLRDGIPVTVLTRSASRSREILGSEVAVVEGDITDESAVRQAVAGNTVVYHLAAAFREPGIPDRRYHEVHVDGTRHLLEAALESQVQRIVHCSTVGVLSHIERPPADETLPYNPGDIYQETKAEGERLALRYARERGAPVTVVRPTSIYGPGDTRLLKLFRTIAKGRFVMIGTGKVYIHLGYVEDIVRGMRLAATSPNALGEVIIIGGEEYQPLNELVGMIAQQLGVARPRWRMPAKPVQLLGSVCEGICIPLGISPPIYRRRVDFFTKSRAFSIEKAKTLLGYRPAVSLQDGIRETIQWYREQGMIPDARTAVATAS